MIIIVAFLGGVPSLVNEQAVVLVSLQEQNDAAAYYIPNFIVEYLRRTDSIDCHFVFRCHPNHKAAEETCRDVLSEFPACRYTIGNSSSSFYAELCKATHHVTAYSTCCYEAEAFGVPTLLYGDDARVIYSQDIADGRFTWTQGIYGEFSNWLENTPPVNSSVSPYFESSLQDGLAILKKMYR